MAISAKQRVIDEIGDMHSSFVRDAIESIGNGTSESSSDSDKFDAIAQAVVSSAGIRANLNNSIGTIAVISPQASSVTPVNTTPIDYSLFVRSSTADDWQLVYSGEAPIHTAELI